ncbi:uncharacterized protein LOC106664558 isoform X2 [Cimex lectularius]|uniref:Apple domain-containing protein n=1 Tax=Cimex lectularius TaxID=79782 RepID=A0A8I6TF86_CIMLE|nr:uncharacterized protein LOC106664558 isoform X2 [Cimex lectularius]
MEQPSALLLLLVLQSTAAVYPGYTTDIECYQRVAIGKRLKETDVNVNVTVATVRQCEQECERSTCHAFSFGVKPGGNGTCEISEKKPEADPIPDVEYDLFYKNSQCLNKTSCFRRLASGRSLIERYVKKTIFCDSLRSCEETCAQETSFNCEGFNFKYGRSGFGQSVCQLTSVPSSKLSLTSDFNSDRDFDFYEKDRNAPRTCYFPFLAYRPWTGYGGPEYGHGGPEYGHGYHPNYIPSDGGHHYGGNQHGGHHYGGHHHHGGRPPVDGYYDGGPPPSEDYPSPNRDDYNPNQIIPHPGWQWDKGHEYGGGGHPAFGLEHGWGLPDECFIRTRSGFRLDRTKVLTSLTVPSLYHCETECANEKMFSCNIFSFRYSVSPAVPSDNCHLGESSSRNLDSYTDILPDRDYDIYERNVNGRDGCQPKQFWGSDCFERVKSGLRLKDSTAKYSLKVPSLRDCESACVRMPYFTCRAFSFRYGPPVIGEREENCLLTDWLLPDMNMQKHFTHDPECELYYRGSYGHGCEIGRNPEFLGGSPHQHGFQHGNYLPPEKPIGGYLPPPKQPDIHPVKPQGFLPPEKKPSSTYPLDNKPPSGYIPPSKPSSGYLPPSKPSSGYLPPSKPSPGYLPPHKPQDGYHHGYGSLERPHGSYLPPNKENKPASYPFRPVRPIGSYLPPQKPISGYPLEKPSGSYFPPKHFGSYLPPDKQHGYYYSEKYPYYGHHHRKPDDSISSSYYPIGKPLEHKYFPPHGTYHPSSSYGVKGMYRPRPTDQLCYIRYSSPARLLPPAIKTSIWVHSEQDCKEECTRAREKTRFRCATLSYMDGQCELSDIEQRDLRLGFDYLEDKEFWMFTWDFGTSGCYYPPPPGKLSNLNDNRIYPDRGLESTWAHYTVNGFPCKTGTVCTQNPEVGVWTCPVENGDWDYCCRSGHQCGFSEGYNYPWCYVGSADKDQWRPCSDSYYPYAHSGRKLHWPVAYLHREGPPNVTLEHKPSIVDTFLKNLEKDKGQKTGNEIANKFNSTMLKEIKLGAEMRTQADVSAVKSDDSAMNKFWILSQSKYNNTDSGNTTLSEITTPTTNNSTPANL